jgi:voltage-gated potassium channel
VSDASLSRRRLQRGRISDFIDRHLLAWELTMGALAIVYLALGILVDDGQSAPEALLTVLGIIFLAEFLVRLADSRSRLGYLRRHWLDLVSCIPLIGGTRSLRLLRLLRLGAAARVISLAEAHAEHRHVDRSSVWFIAPFLLVVWFAASAAYWQLEHGISRAVHDFGDALQWTFLTTVTVGYGAPAPTSSEARILAGGLIFLGIGLVGFLSSRLTTRLLDVHDDHHVQHAQKLVSLEERLANIESLLTEIAADQRRAAAPRPRAASPSIPRRARLSDDPTTERPPT